jgi:hypothetical protein
VPASQAAPVSFRCAASLVGLSLSGGTLGGSGDLSVSGLFDWSGGSIGGAAGTTLSTSGTTNIAGTGSALSTRMWTNTGR